MGASTPKYALPYPDPADPTGTWRYWEALAKRMEAALTPIEARSASAGHIGAGSAWLDQRILANGAVQKIGELTLPAAPIRRYCYVWGMCNVGNDATPTDSPWYVDFALVVNSAQIADARTHTDSGYPWVPLYTVSGMVIEANTAISLWANIYILNGNSVHAGPYSQIAALAFPYSN